MTSVAFRKRFVWRLLSLLVLVGLLLAVTTWYWLDRPVGDVLRYVERRLQGHTKLELVAIPVISWVRPWIEQPVPERLELSDRGARPSWMNPITHDHRGRPVTAVAWLHAPPTLLPGQRLKTVSDAASLLLALRRAQPGDVIELMPGVYHVDEAVTLSRGGTARLPVVVRSSVPLKAVVHFNTLEGFHVQAPYWVFEGLSIKGVCRVHSHCEHAFHVVAKGRGVVIRNNHIEDFNAHIKVNGWPPRHWPDDGLILSNTLSNQTARDTENPVTPVDVVAANGWVVKENLIKHFVRRGGNRVSYGVFMKGGGQNGIIESNHIICTTSEISQPGQRVGLSFGGGGTSKSSCRDGECVIEFAGGVAAGNLIEHCNDVGIYLNRASMTILKGNFMRNTYGVLARYPETSVELWDNQFDSGRVRGRDGALVHFEP